jgi:hypothetical protein
VGVGGCEHEKKEREREKEREKEKEKEKERERECVLEMVRNCSFILSLSLFLLLWTDVLLSRPSIKPPSFPSCLSTRTELPDVQNRIFSGNSWDR